MPRTTRPPLTDKDKAKRAAAKLRAAERLAKQAAELLDGRAWAAHAADAADDLGRIGGRVEDYIRGGMY